MTIGGRSLVGTPVGRTLSSQFGAASVDPVSAPDLVLWLDAGDASTIHSTGGLVDRWDDKSTYGQDFTATLLDRPSTGTRTINGVNVIDFDALTNRMGSTWIADPGATSVVTAWLVIVIDTNAANRVLFLSDGTASLGAFIQARTSAIIDITAGAGSLDSAAGKFTTGVPFIMKMIWKQVSGALIRTTGTTDTTGATGNWSNTNPGHRMWFAANDAAGTHDPIDAGIGELIVYNTDKDAALSAAIDSYLATKWGLVV